MSDKESEENIGQIDARSTSQEAFLAAIRDGHITTVVADAAHQQALFDACWNEGYRYKVNLIQWILPDGRRVASRGATLDVKGPDVESDDLHGISAASLTSDRFQRDDGRPQAVVPTTMGKVKVVDIDMPFWSMVNFMVKWALASIPAMFIVFLAVWSMLFLASTIGLWAVLGS